MPVLSEISNASEINLLVSACTPANWSPLRGEAKLQQLAANSEEFQHIAGEINSSLRVHVYSVVRVQNPYLWGCYQLKKLEYQAKGVHVEEKCLYHCTSASNSNSIASDNFDWHRTSRGKFGIGVSFSPCAWYANKYANRNIGTERAMILAEVLVGLTTNGKYNMVIPPEPFDTTLGKMAHGKYAGITNVVVKFCDYEFYPSYIAYYNCLSSPNSNKNSHGPLYKEPTKPRLQTQKLSKTVKQANAQMAGYSSKERHNYLDIKQKVQPDPVINRNNVQNNTQADMRINRTVVQNNTQADMRINRNVGQQNTQADRCENTIPMQQDTLARRRLNTTTVQQFPQGRQVDTPNSRTFHPAGPHQPPHNTYAREARPNTEESCCISCCSIS